MANIITLGCAVADLHHRYSAIHSALFGAASYRLVLSALTGKTATTYGGYEQTLTDLEQELTRLEQAIAGLDAGERVSRGADLLPQTLIVYSQALREVMAGLKGICGELKKDEKGYREITTEGRSRFNRDKIVYDHAISELERLGTRLNRLFSTY